MARIISELRQAIIENPRISKMNQYQKVKMLRYVRIKNSAKSQKSSNYCKLLLAIKSI